MPTLRRRHQRSRTTHQGRETLLSRPSDERDAQEDEDDNQRNAHDGIPAQPPNAIHTVHSNLLHPKHVSEVLQHIVGMQDDHRDHQPDNRGHKATRETTDSPLPIETAPKRQQRKWVINNTRRTAQTKPRRKRLPVKEHRQQQQRAGDNMVNPPVI